MRGLDSFITEAEQEFDSKRFSSLEGEGSGTQQDDSPAQHATPSSPQSPERVVGGWESSPQVPIRENPTRILNGATSKGNPERFSLTRNPYLKHRRKKLHDAVLEVEDHIESHREKEPMEDNYKTEKEFNDAYDKWENEDTEMLSHEYFQERGIGGGSIEPHRFPGGIEASEGPDTEFEDLVRDYTFGGAYELNNFLRQGSPRSIESITEEDVDVGMRIWQTRLMGMMMPYEGPNAYNPVFRGIRGLRDILKDLKKGHLLRDPGFMSTTTNMGSAYDFVDHPDEVMQIHAPFNIPGLQVNPDRHSVIHQSHDEEEIILPPNLLLQYLGDNNFHAFAPHTLTDKAFSHLMKGESIEDLIQAADTEENEDGEMLEYEDYEREWLKGGRMNYGLYEEKEQREMTPFQQRMNDFQFEIIKPGRKKFDEFTENK
jgi:hypothetical protein